MAAIKHLKMYAMDTPCERDIFRIFSPTISNLIYDVIPPKGQHFWLLGIC